MAETEAEFAARVAARIHSLRTARGLSIRGLARAAELPPELVSRSEREKTLVSLPSLVKLSGAFGVSLSEFFEFEAEPALAEPMSLELRKAVTLLSSLDAGALKRAVRGLELLLTAGSMAVELSPSEQSEGQGTQLGSVSTDATGRNGRRRAAKRTQKSRR